jgi:hypothetical protein
MANIIRCLNNTKKVFNPQLQEVVRPSTNYKTGETVLDYYYDGVQMGLVQYHLKTGQIGMLLIHKNYCNMGIGKYIVGNIIEEMKENNNSELWLISNKNHTFWSNVFNKSFSYRSPITDTLPFGGFYMKL